MKVRILVSLIFLIPSVLFFLGGNCDSNGGGVTPTIVGTWVNSAYDVEEGHHQKLVISDNGDGTFTSEAYSYVSDTEPNLTLIFTVTDEWTDSEGNLFYKCEGPFPDPTYVYVLFKIHADNQTFEMNFSGVGYPTEIDPAGEDYVIFYRQ